MSNFKEKPFVREEVDVQVIGGVARGQGGKGGRSLGLISLKATTDLPDASKLPDGSLVYDLTAAKLKIVVAGTWVIV
jgi:hypothetical protein